MTLDRGRVGYIAAQMDFGEKIGRFTKGAKRSHLSRAAGLPATMLSNYVNRKSVPRADIALRVARAMGVPLEWLVDDSQDWPPPVTQPSSPASFSDTELMMELARRHRLGILRIVDLLDEAERTDWGRVAAQVANVAEGKASRESLAQTIRLLSLLHWLQVQVFNAYDLYKFAELHHARLPGADKPPDSLDWVMISERTQRLRANPAFEQVNGALGMQVLAVGMANLPDMNLPPDHRYAASQVAAKELQSAPGAPLGTYGYVGEPPNQKVADAKPRRRRKRP